MKYLNKEKFSLLSLEYSLLYELAYKIGFPKIIEEIQISKNNMNMMLKNFYGRNLINREEYKILTNKSKVSKNLRQTISTICPDIDKNRKYIEYFEDTNEPIENSEKEISKNENDEIVISDYTIRKESDDLSEFFFQNNSNKISNSPFFIAPNDKNLEKRLFSCY